MKNECNDTGDVKVWIKTCPKCSVEMLFHSKHGFISSIKRATKCSVCKSRREINHIGERFGKLTIIRQYYVKNKTNLKVDYICDCGNETCNKVFGKVKTQTMCLNCSKTNAHKKLPNGEASFNSVYNSYLRNSKRRNLEFTLTKEQMKMLTKQKCFYCGESPSLISRPTAKSGGYVYNGVDRKNNNLGYTLDNTVSCCKRCNNAKWDLSTGDFLSHIEKLYKYNFVEDRRR